MYVLSTTEMSEIDRRMINEYGVSGAMLMENAGKAVVNGVEDIYEVSGKRVLVACGKGNNGGDGYVAARLLYEKGAKVYLLMSEETDDISGDSRLMLEQVPKEVERINTSFAKEQEFDIAIDAVFGTGFKGAAEGKYAEIIKRVNACKTVFAIDIPSGVNGNTGVCEGECVKADYTFALCREKLGHRLFPGKLMCGKILVCDIGITDEAVNAQSPKIELLEKDYMDTHLRRLLPTDHKGDNGKLVIIGGSLGMAGSVCLAAQAALRAGVGLCYVIVPKSIYGVVAGKLTEAMVIPVEDGLNHCICPLDIEKMKRYLEKADAIVMGCGMSFVDETKQTVSKIAKLIKVPIVVDADGINALSERHDFFNECGGKIVITPHNMEMARVSGCSLEEIKANRIEKAMSFAREKSCIVALKGSGTFVTDGKRGYINTSGNEGMATGGSGDALSGVIGAFLACGMEPLKATGCAVYAHGMAGDLAAERLSKRGMIASDIINSLPYCFK
ncbi:MAG: NAD(P)H-hydrate dehydratase [Clostridia bacterium]|nr:NAD(P)H-hydrate dehydratase [Clostridia bacterium]